MTKLVLRSDAHDIATLTLNRSEKRNALNLAMWAELEAHITSIEAAGPAIGAVVLAANGPTFCAGADFTERGTPKPEPYYQAKLVSRIAGLAQPVIAAVQGGCFTGGLELALAADIIIAAQSALFADTHGRFALVPVWGLSQRLPRRIGQSRAREMSFTGLPVSGARAEQIGLANICVPDGDLAAETQKIAKAIAGQSRHSVFAYKRLYNEQEDLPLQAGLAHEVFNSSGAGAEAAARVAGR